MQLWNLWFDQILFLRQACSRKRTFMWLAVCILGFSIRHDLAGVTSIIRVLGLKEKCYKSLTDFFHTDSLDTKKLQELWIQIVLNAYKKFLLKISSRIILIADGLKTAKSGKKMPGVKCLHQSSESNTKRAYIDGHSYQAISILAHTLNSYFAVPLMSKITEGIVKSNRDKRSLLDKLIDMLDEMALELPCYLVADAYYGSGKMLKSLLKRGHHLVCRARSNGVANLLPVPKKKTGRGRKAKYGKKIALKTLAAETEKMTAVESPAYGEKDVIIKYRCIDLMWRSAGDLVRYVIVVHPVRGTIFLFSSDLSLTPFEIIRIYSLRFKIEVAFKQALRTVGSYSYHFWMKSMKKKKRMSGNMYLHKESETYRKRIDRKLRAYHCYVMIGIISQGLMQLLSLTYPQLVWKHFGSWIRTRKIDSCPTEWVVSKALLYTLPEFLMSSGTASSFVKFLVERIDFRRGEAIKLAA